MLHAQDWKKLAYGQQDYLTAIRREFHRHPELSAQEHRTREVLMRELDAMGIPYQKLEGTGLIATIKGGKPGDCKMLRADIDGLPVLEDPVNLKQEKRCVSEDQGLCHACGHDGHMAMLLTTLKILNAHKEELPGTILGCFEEGEEETTGVSKMLKALEAYPVKRCFALHVYANLQAGKLSMVPGPRMAGTVGIGITFTGKAGHGSRPDQARNPIIPAAHFISELNSAFLNQLDAEQTTTLGLCKVRAGETTNVIPDRAYVGGTARYFNKAEGEKAFHLVNAAAEHVAAIHGCGVEYEDRHQISLPPVVNDAAIANQVHNGVIEMCGESALEDCDKWYASESFSLYMDKYPGALGLLGIRNEALGSGAAHHNGKFDIDESTLPLGVCAELVFALDL